MSGRETWYFTFGVGHPNAGTFVVADNCTYDEARALMFGAYGQQWGFQYDEAGWLKHGVSQAEKYGLTLLARLRESAGET